MKKIILLLSIILLVSLCVFLTFFKDTDQHDQIDIPLWAIQDLCNHPKILALSNRNVLFRNGTIPMIGLDLFMSLIANFTYFRIEPYLTIIDVNSNQIIYEMPRMMRIDSILLSKDGKWILYVNGNNTILQSLKTGLKKRVDEISPRFFDWSTDGKKIIFLGDHQTLYFADLSSCLNDSKEDCNIIKQPIQYYIKSYYSINYARIIDDQHIFIKTQDDKPKADLITTKGEIIKELLGFDCQTMDYNPVSKQYVFFCQQEMDIYTSNLVKISSTNLTKTAEYAFWSPNKRQIAFISEDDPDLKHIFDISSENSFYPSRLYVMTELNKESIQPLYRRTDEHIAWFSWLYGGQVCQTQ